MRTFLLCLAVVGLSGIAVVVGGSAMGASTESELMSLLAFVYGIVLIAAFVLGIVAARRSLRAWLAGYVGAVLGGWAVLVVGDVLLGPGASFADILIGSAMAAVAVFAPLVGLAFLVAGGLTLAARRISS